MKITNEAIRLLLSCTDEKKFKREQLQGIEVEKYKNGWRLVSTDTAALAVIEYRRKTEGLGDFVEGKIITKKAFTEYLESEGVKVKGGYDLDFKKVFKLNYCDGFYPRYQSVFEGSASICGKAGRLGLEFIDGIKLSFENLERIINFAKTAPLDVIVKFYKTEDAMIRFTVQCENRVFVSGVFAPIVCR